MKSIIFALVLFFPTAITTSGFQLALTSKIINLTRSRTQTAVPPSTTKVVAVAPPSKPDSNNKRSSIIALATTSSSLLSIIHRPNVACAATTATAIIPPSPLSSVSLIDPAILTTEGFSVIHSNNNKNLLSVLMTTFMSTIQMKQHSMAMFAIAVGMTVVLLKCAEGGYVKFVEFVAEQCLGYYGMKTTKGVVVDAEETKKKKKKVDWNDYVLRLSRRLKKSAVVIDDDDDDKIVLDTKTMLFQQPAAKVAKDRYDDIMMERANQSYREKQYEQHHHDTDLSTTTTSSSDDLDAPSRSSWNKYKTTLDTLTQNQVEHDETSDKLQIMKNLLTWEDYKHLVSELQLKKEECSMLQEEVSSLKKLLQVERTVHSYHTPQVVVDNSGSDDDKELELKTLEDKAKEYDEAIQQAKVKDGDSVRWH